MKALVTGGAGFVGTNLINKLIKDGHEVVSIDNYSTGFTENHNIKAKYHNLDVAKVTSYTAYIKPDVVFHLAALARIQPSLKDPRKCIENNFNGTFNVVEWCRLNGIPLVYAGSSSMHHGLYGSPYAWSKFGGEELCRLYTEAFGLKTAICRFYNVYGDHQLEDGDYATVVGIFLKQFREGKPLTITSDGEQRRDFTHVDFIVEGLARCAYGLLNNTLIEGETFELGTGSNHSINELADMFPPDHPREYVPKRKGEYDSTLCDISHAEEVLGYEPKDVLKDYIRKEINA